MELRKVMLVDDDEDIRSIAEMSLRDVGGFEVCLACSGEEALIVAKREMPDLIVLDVMMPGLDGPATLERLRAEAETSTIPVVFMTAKVQGHEVRRWLELGAAAVIAKPFDPMALPDELRRIASAP